MCIIMVFFYLVITSCVCVCVCNVCVLYVCVCGVCVCVCPLDWVQFYSLIRRWNNLILECWQSFLQFTKRPSVCKQYNYKQTLAFHTIDWKQCTHFNPHYCLNSFPWKFTQLLLEENCEEYCSSAEATSASNSICL